jgi:hypothetical protein
MMQAAAKNKSKIIPLMSRLSVAKMWKGNGVERGEQQKATPRFADDQAALRFLGVACLAA